MSAATSRRPRPAPAAVAGLAAALLAGCAAAAAGATPAGTPGPAPLAAWSTSPTDPATTSDPTTAARPSATPGTSTTTTPTTPSDPVTIPAAPPAPPPAPPAPEPPPVPAALAAGLGAALADERLAGATVGASVWVEGHGEVLAVNPDLPLIPASNQKILTGMAALEVLGPDAVVGAGPLAGRRVAEVSASMLTTSDNAVADALLAEVGRVTAGTATPEAGGVVAEAALEPLAGPLDGTSADGSGLRVESRRSAEEWRRLLEVAATRPWSAEFTAGLPVAGRTGTLSGRMVGTAAEDNARAKTGTHRGVRALSGYLTTAGGRAVVFSLVVNDSAQAAAAAGALDRLVVTLAADES